MAKTLFDADLESEAGEIGQVVTTLVTSFLRNLGPLADLRLRLPLPSSKRILAARARLETAIQAMIAERRAGGDRGDLLSMLIAAQDDEDENRRMSDQQVRDEVLTLFLAGHETTANALTWSLYLLSQNPEAARLLHEESGARAATGAAPPMQTWKPALYAHGLERSDASVPPGLDPDPQALEDVEIGGYLLPKGATALLSQWVVHHNERYYPEPLRFDPGRWTPDQDRRAPEDVVLPLRGRFARLHRRILRLDGRHAAAGDDRPKMGHDPRAGFPHRTAGADHPAAKHGMRMPLKRR